jgi:outer membrane protein assembly factor BamA
MKKNKIQLMNWQILLLIITLASTTVNAQKRKKEKNVRILPFPAVSFSPETKWLYGAGAASTFRLHPKHEKERPSSVNGGIAYTQNKQILLFTQFNIFNKDKSYFFGELGYFKFSFFYYGIGQNEVAEELYKVQFPRIKINAVKRVSKLAMIGVGIHYENFNITEKKIDGQLQNGTIPGANSSRLTGLGAAAILDSRDSVFFPRKGMFGNFSIYNYGNHFGGNVNFNRIIADVAFYKKLGKKNVFAAQLYNSVMVGNVPFQAQAQVGGPKLLRGYYMGRYTDKNMSLLQTEARIKLYKRFSATLFASTAALGSEDNTFLRFNDLKTAYGAGVRYTFNRKDHLNVRLDYAKGKDKGFFYFTIGEAF